MKTWVYLLIALLPVQLLAADELDRQTLNVCFDREIFDQATEDRLLEMPESFCIEDAKVDLVERVFYALGSQETGKFDLRIVNRSIGQYNEGWWEKYGFTESDMDEVKS